MRDAFDAATLGLGGTHIGKVPGIRIYGILVDTSLVVHQQHTHVVVLSDHHPVSAWVSSGVDLD